MFLLQVHSYRCAYVKNLGMHGVVLAGGWNVGAIGTSYLFNLDTEKWEKMGDLNEHRYQAELIVLEVSKERENFLQIKYNNCI